MNRRFLPMIGIIVSCIGAVQSLYSNEMKLGTLTAFYEASLAQDQTEGCVVGLVDDHCTFVTGTVTQRCITTDKGRAAFSDKCGEFQCCIPIYRHDLP